MGSSEYRQVFQKRTTTFLALKMLNALLYELPGDSPRSLPGERYIPNQETRPFCLAGIRLDISDAIASELDLA
jgi:hypothetical protein